MMLLSGGHGARHGAHHGGNLNAGGNASGHHGAGLHSGHGQAGNAHGLDPKAGSQHGTTISNGTHNPAPSQISNTGSSGGLAPLLNLLFVSPLDIFGFMIGFGAFGITFFSKLPLWALIIAAFIVGNLFFRVLIRPVLGGLRKFESKPSLGIESLINQTADSLGGFDRAGQGLVLARLDGQSLRLLAQLSPDERALAPQIKKGDQLLIIAINPTSNTCIVSKELENKL